MGQPATDAFETWAKWKGGRQAELHGTGVPLLAGRGPRDGSAGTTWTAEALLTGAVEVSVMLAFLHEAERLGLRPLFYQSSAEGRVVVEGDGMERLTDLIVRPRVGVRSEQESRLVEVIFEHIPRRCRLGSMLRSVPRVHPIIELWPGGESEEEHTPARAAP